MTETQVWILIAVTVGMVSSILTAILIITFFKRGPQGKVGKTGPPGRDGERGRDGEFTHAYPDMMSEQEMRDYLAIIDTKAPTPLTPFDPHGKERIYQLPILEEDCNEQCRGTHDPKEFKNGQPFEDRT